MRLQARGVCRLLCITGKRWVLCSLDALLRGHSDRAHLIFLPKGLPAPTHFRS